MTITKQDRDDAVATTAGHRVLVAYDSARADLAVAREMLDAKDAELSAMAKTLSERDALCESQTRTIAIWSGKAGKAQAGWDAAKAAYDEMERAYVEVKGARDAIYTVARIVLPEVDGGPVAVMHKQRDIIAMLVNHDKADKAAIAKAEAERDAAIAAKEAAEAGHKGAINAWQMICEERNDAVIRATAAESREHALGVQVVALQKRLVLLGEGADILRDISDAVRAVPSGFDDHYLIEKATIDIGVGCFLANVDAVPGDALATCKPGLQVGVDYREASGVDVERLSVPAYDGEDEVAP